MARYQGVVRGLFGVLVAGLVTACNSTAPMDVKVAPTLDTRPIDSSQVEASFVLSGLVIGVPRGQPIFAFPANPPTSGQLCNALPGGDQVATSAGGRNYLGNWSDDVGEMFFTEFSRVGYRAAGDPSAMFDRARQARSADYQVAGRIIEMAGNFCGEHSVWDNHPLYSYSGEISMTVEWSVLSNLTREVVLKTRSDGYFKQQKPSSDGIVNVFAGAVGAAMANLAADSSMRRLALGEPLGQTAAATTDTGVSVLNGAAPGRFDPDEIAASVVTIRLGGGHGSGFFVGTEGYVLTNAHVVQDARQVQVVTDQGITVTAEVVASNRLHDVALLKTPLGIGKPPELLPELPAVAATVYAVGTPILTALDTTVTRGIVSALRRDAVREQEFIQADVAVSSGNSGGPLVNDRGQIIGITVARIGSTDAEGLNLFIPIGEALRVLGIRLRS